MDDIIIAKTNSKGVCQLKASLHASFHTKDLGNLTYFLSRQIHTSNKGIFINQYKYTKDLIALAYLENSTLVDTPLKVNVKYCKDDSDILFNPMLHRLVGSFVCLTITCPNIYHAINLVRQFITNPGHLHLTAIEHIVCYLLGTLEHGMFFSTSPHLHLTAYSNIDWARCPSESCQSTTRWCMYLGNAGALDV